MRLFIRRVLLFTLLLIVLAGIIIGLCSVYMNRVRFPIDPGKHILVIGDSHTECAVDDSVFSRAVNFSQSGMSIVYSFAALRKLVADNPHIDTVILSFHTGSLLVEREQGWIYDEAVMAKRVPVFLPYFDAADYGLFIKKPLFYQEALRVPQRALAYYRLERVGKQQEWIDEHIGAFRDFRWSNFSRDTAQVKPLEHPDAQEPVSSVHVAYVRKFADLCKAKGITLVLLNAPVYAWKKYDNYVGFEINRQRYFKDILYLNYAELPLPDSGRLDIHHLNGIGAREFSRYLDLHFSADAAQLHP